MHMFCLSVPSAPTSTSTPKDKHKHIVSRSTHRIINAIPKRTHTFKIDRCNVVDSINYRNYFVPDKAVFNENKWQFIRSACVFANAECWARYWRIGKMKTFAIILLTVHRMNVGIFRAIELIVRRKKGTHAPNTRAYLIYWLLLRIGTHKMSHITTNHRPFNLF